MLYVSYISVKLEWKKKKKKNNPVVGQKKPLRKSVFKEQREKEKFKRK